MAPNPVLGEIRMIAFGFPPSGWALCQGQSLSIAEDQDLFQLIGTTYGGDGKSTFALPDLQARVPVEQGQGQGLSEYFLGQEGGEEFVTLIQTEMPGHNHTLNASTDTATEREPQNQTFATGSGVSIYDVKAPGTTLNPQALAVQGGSLPHNNLQPYLVLNFCIALQGVFPPRG